MQNYENNLVMKKNSLQNVIQWEKKCYLCGQKLAYQMLEFKNISVGLENGRLSKPFSLVIEDGDIVSICGNSGSGKSSLLRAVLGLEPICNGFITIDGELVTSGSASYFRRMIAYVPQHMPHNKISVGELLNSLLDLRNSYGMKFDEEQMFAEWQMLGISKILYDETLDKIDDDILQKILVSFLPMLNKKIILIDNLAQAQAIEACISRLAVAKAEVIFTCEENKMSCNKIVNL